MSAVATAERAARTLFDDRKGGEPTLDDELVCAWEGLIAHRLSTCPVCAGEMSPQYGPHALPVGGRCSDCGSKLA